MKKSDILDSKPKTPVERLIKYLYVKGSNMSKFEKEAGYSNGALSKLQKNGTTEMSGKMINKVSELYPDLNLVWLIKGEGYGEMINKKIPKPAPSEKINLKELRRNWLIDAINHLQKVEGLSQKEIAATLTNRKGEPLTSGAISIMKSGKSPVSPRIIKQICKAYNYDYDLPVSDHELAGAAKEPGVTYEREEIQSLPPRWQVYIKGLEQRNDDLQKSLNLIQQMIEQQTPN